MTKWVVESTHPISHIEEVYEIIIAIAVPIV